MISQCILKFFRIYLELEFFVEHFHDFVIMPSVCDFPEKHSVLFADGNKLNLSIDNLLLVSKAELLMLNRRRLISENSEITKTGLNVVKVMNKIHKIKKEGG